MKIILNQYRLNNLYNFFPSDSKFRYQLFLQILKYAVESNNTFAVISVFPTVPTLFEEWRAKDEQKRNIYKEMYNVLLANSNNVQCVLFFLFFLIFFGGQ